ncbi:glycoside hydrolase family 3 protein [Acetonema longum]|nr:glycoside hydrolase family 3 protein [Acetonema longum]
MRMMAWILFVCSFLLPVFADAAQAAPAGYFGREVQVELALRSMDIEAKVGQMLLPAFRQYEGKDMTELPDSVADSIRRHHLGGVILFSGNITGVEQTVGLIHGIQQAAGSVPLFVAIDQEGGRVIRLSYGTGMPGNMALGAAGDPRYVFQAAEIIGRELKALGFNVNFAPVLDVNSNPDNPVIGVRSFSENPDVVAQMGQSYIRGLHAAGVAAAVKHFPGHGDTAMDSHLGIAVVPHDKKRLQAVELKPFREALAAGPDMVMTAHVTFPAFDRTTAISKKDGRPIQMPATLSHAVLTGLLRRDMGFEGLIVTDSLGMRAISDHFGPEAAAVLAVKAGADILLMPPDLSAVYTALLQAVKSGDISEERINQSVRRILRAKYDRGIWQPKSSKPSPRLATQIRWAKTVVASPDHRRKEAEISEKAITLLKNENHLLPFDLRQARNVLFLAPGEESYQAIQQALAETVAKAGARTEVSGVKYEKSGLTPAIQQAIDRADYIILATHSYDVDGRTPGRSRTADFSLATVNYANQRGKPLAVMMIRNPYDMMYLTGAKAVVALYGGGEGPNISAGLRIIFGLAKPGGKLPVSIPNPDGTGYLYRSGHGLTFAGGK